MKRTAGIGILSKEHGPELRLQRARCCAARSTARKGDPDWDLRKIEPYCGYETYDFKAIMPPFDDEYTRPYRRRR